jgi:cullin-associated NEDD8-dissociated protein 1
MSSSHHGSHSSSSSSSSSSINALLKKTEHYDKDERYMATSDLCELLKRPTSSSGDSNSNSNSHSHSHSHSNSNNNTSSNKNTSNSNSNSNNTNKNFDSSTERRICTAVLRLLHDKSNDVQAVAVKTLGVLLQTVPQELVLEIGDSLTDQVLDAGKSELRDVYSIGLRTLVKTIPSNMGDSTSNRLITRLLDGIRNSTTSSAITSGRKNKPIKIDDDDDDINNEDQDPAATAKETAEAKEKEEIVLSCLDVLTDLLGRFGATSIAVTRQHEPVLQICLQLISNKGDEQTSPVVRKRAGNALGCLSIVLSDALLVSAVERLLSQIEDNNNTTIITNNSNSNAGNANSTSTTGGGGSNMENTRALIRTMCTISGAVGHRLQQPQIDRIIPIFLTFTNPEKASTGDDEDDCDDDDDAGVGGDGGDDNDDVMNAGDDSSQDVDEAVVQMVSLIFLLFPNFFFVRPFPSYIAPFSRIQMAFA